MSTHSKQYFHQTRDRGNSRNGSVPVMSTHPIGQSVIDMTSVFTAAFPLRRRGVPIFRAPIEQVDDGWRVFTRFPLDLDQILPFSLFTIHD